MNILCLLAMVLSYSSAVYGQSVPRPLFGTDTFPGTSISDTTPQLRWTSATGASSYDIEVLDNGNGELVVEIEGRSTTSYTTPALARGRDYLWRVRGCNGSGCSSYSDTYYFNITGTAPNAPTPSFGSDASPGPTISDTTPRLQWSSVTGASSYGIVVRSVTNNEIVVSVDGRSGTAYTTPALLGARTYKWSVRACSNSGCGAYSNPFYFRIEETVPGSPNPLLGSSTAPGTSLSDTTPRLRWSSESGATSYDIDVRDLTTNQLVVNVDGNTATSYTTPTLIRGRSYRWNVRACNSAGCGASSSNRFFRISGTVVDAPELLFGSVTAPGTSTTDDTPQLRWTAVSGATSYDIDVFDSTTGRLVVNIDGRTSTSFTTPVLTNGRSFRWNVRACNSLGCSDRSQDAFFIISKGSTVPATTILLLGG